MGRNESWDGYRTRRDNRRELGMLNGEILGEGGPRGQGMRRDEGRVSGY